MKRKGLLIVISGPSGVGKGTIVKRLVEDDCNMRLSVSATTRKKRDGEEHGVNYYYMTKEEFETQKAQDGFMESAFFCDNYYGTPKKEVLSRLEDGIDVILEIEVMGAMQVRAKYPEGVFVFVIPPSLSELENRLRSRQTEDEETVRKRLAKACEEMKYINKYNYVVLNDDIETAVGNIKSVVAAEKLRIERNQERLKESGLV